MLFPAKCPMRTWQMADKETEVYIISICVCQASLYIDNICTCNTPLGRHDV